MKSEQEIAELVESDELRKLIDTVRPGCEFYRLDRTECREEAVYQLDLFCPTNLDTQSMLACPEHRDFFATEMLPLINGPEQHGDHVLTVKALA